MNTSIPWDYCHIYMPPFLVYAFLWWLKMKYIVIYKIVILCYSILNEPKLPPPHPKKIRLK